MLKDPGATLIYDGECRFCAACLAWVEQELEISSIPFQEAKLDKYGLLRSQCEKSVFLLTKEGTFSGAAAVGRLLKLRGNTRLAWILHSSGWAGRLGYRWIATHRDSFVIRIATRCLEWVVARKA
jgi:predicted DCC family thiol-disulfide oxidoreductase YuxK